MKLRLNITGISIFVGLIIIGLFQLTGCGDDQPPISCKGNGLEGCWQTETCYILADKVGKKFYAKPILRFGHGRIENETELFETDACSVSYGLKTDESNDFFGLKTYAEGEDAPEALAKENSVTKYILLGDSKYAIFQLSVIDTPTPDDDRLCFHVGFISVSKVEDISSKAEVIRYGYSDTKESVNEELEETPNCFIREPT